MPALNNDGSLLIMYLVPVRGTAASAKKKKNDMVAGERNTLDLSIAQSYLSAAASPLVYRRLGSKRSVSAASSAVGRSITGRRDGAVTRFAGERPMQQAVEDAKKDF